MSRRALGWLLALAWAAGGCSGEKAAEQKPTVRRAATGSQADADALGQEVFELVDRAVDYRGSHRGRPAASFRQMGIDSLTPATVRRLVNLAREPVITVAFRKPEAREITSCRGDSQILEEATLNGGRFTVMCTTGSGVQRPMRVGTAGR